MIRLGIDTGGTFTDAVVIDMSEGGVSVLAKAKALTTKGDLSRGIGNAIDALPSEVLQMAEAVALSTTLATNACVEGKGGRAKLIIIGSTDEVLHRVDAQNKFGIPYSDVLTLPFEGSYDGGQVVVPDWEALYEANRSFFDEADSFGIASIYALNNGAVVEHEGAKFLQEKFGKFVVEATSVAVKPNVIERGATALLNARLVPVINDFLDAIELALKQRGITAPVSIVRSDGTLMTDELARTRPVETILSGPAASVRGAQVLAGDRESLVIDIGGTTSDISVIHDGQPVRTNGIFIGGWKTQVPGVAIDTIALGGDTQVRFTKSSRLELGTRRVTPLCIASDRWPEVKPLLKTYFERSGFDLDSRYEIFYLARDPGDITRFTWPEQQFLELLREGLLSRFEERSSILGLKTERLEDEGIVMRIGLTPTDAMHIRGDFSTFDAEASRLGIQCVLKNREGAEAALEEDRIRALADEIYDLGQQRLFKQVIGVLAEDVYWKGEPQPLGAQLNAIADTAWSTRHSDAQASFEIRFECASTLVGAGAPTHVFIYEVANALGAPCSVPEHSEVANAVGAAASAIAVEEQVRIAPIRQSDGVVYGHRVLGSGRVADFEVFDEAMSTAYAWAEELAMAEARRRGAIGDLHCMIVEERNVYQAAGTFELVKDYTITARVN